MIVNYQVFSGWLFVDLIGVEAAGGVVDRATRFLIHALFEEKFYSLFSLLFGIGFSIFLRRSSQRGAAFAPLFRRRLALLMGFGFVHAILIWFGDILILYALLGFVLLAFRDRSDRTVLAWSAGLLASPILVFGLLLVGGVGDPFAGGDGRSIDALFERIVEVLREGSYADVVRTNAWFYAIGWARHLFTLRLPKVLGMFLIGVWLDRRDVFRDVEGNRALLMRAAGWGLAIGLPATVAAVAQGNIAWPASPRGFLQTALWTVGVPALTLAYASSIALLMRRPVWRRFWMTIAPLGRASLTNYLTQSVIGVALFYGIGFGLFQRLSRPAVFAIALAVYLIQVALSRLWMERFPYGPAEWLWRRLTYGPARI